MSDRTCKEICKKFKAQKPGKKGRYASGQANCLICNIWIDHRGAKLQDGSPATKGSIGWSCVCCNYRVRQKPRNRVYKEKLRESQNSSKNIPKYHQLMLPILQNCNDRNACTQQELVDILADKFNLSEENRSLILRKKETLMSNRTHWAILYLKKANLLTKKENHLYITKEGQELLEQNPLKIDKNLLLKIPAFAEFYNKSSNKKQPQIKETVLDLLITQSLNLIKKDEIYLSDLVRNLKISDDVRDLFVHKLFENQKIINKNIKYQGKLLDVLFQYNFSKNDVDDNIDSLKTSTITQEDDMEDALEYFNKFRAEIMQKIAQGIPENKEDFKIESFHDVISGSGVTIHEIIREFDMSIEKLIDFAYTMNPPNKLSMIREFERIKSDIGRVPTKQDIDEYSELKSSQYDEKFQSWEHMLERLGYDPWYRKAKNHKDTVESDIAPNVVTHKKLDKGLEHVELEILKQDIKKGLKDEPIILELFSILDQNIGKCNKEKIQYYIDVLDF